MKILAPLVVLCMVGATSVLLFGFSDAKTGSSATDVASTHHVDTMVNTVAGRKFKGNGNSLNSELKFSEEGSVSLEDYRPVDPAPSSKASIKPGPIVHGAPFMPYIPKPSPPGPPQHGG
ncbi:uncharacterized protein LOC115739576 isoform X2 [Rhodamnia argentea]|uniref:Uncharacterized protein LOC115739576 isoform X2 n=1 Tax=Rhodamnia argentea TaxID=178133 RepID=A0A8B8P192_9MYRT|nr:uncharacterized protein LOC115739576 isoform X2 [Rhodamnia argentea]